MTDAKGPSDNSLWDCKLYPQQWMVHYSNAHTATVFGPYGTILTLIY